MKIGFDAKRLFNNFTGLGNYSRTLVEDIQSYFPQNQYYLFTPKTKHAPRNASFFDARKYQIVMPKNVGALWRTRTVLKNDIFKSLDVYHGLSHELPFGIEKSKLLKVVTIHDLIFRYFPEDYHIIDRKIYDLKFKYACQNADRIIAISHHTKEDIIKIYGIPEQNIHVVYQSCDKSFSRPVSSDDMLAVKSKYDLPEDYMLYVGSVIGRKNLGGIIDAMKTIPKDKLIPLVIIGSGRQYEKSVRRKISDMGLDQHCFWIQPEFKDFPMIYAGATIFILLSFYEGFGIPLLEAMSVGTPVITSDQSAPKEIVGDAGFTVSPSNTDAIREAIVTVLSDSSLQQLLSERGKKRAQFFHPEKITKQIMQIYQR